MIAADIHKGCGHYLTAAEIPDLNVGHRHECLGVDHKVSHARTRLQLNLAKERLCNAGLLAKSAPSTKLFRKHPTLFALTPEAAPNKVQYLRPSGQ